jgi:hypothetical protein
MDEFDGLSDGELLYRLRLEYATALKLGDFEEINSVILPGFWDRFGRYYPEFERSWKAAPRGTPVHLVLGPTDDKTLEIDWMDQVLQGHIDLDFSLDL